MINRRWPLLLALLPLLLLAGVEARRFDPMYVTDAAFSADGRRLYLCRSVISISSEWQYVTDAYEVQAWDVASGRLLATHEAVRAKATIGGKGLVSWTPEGRLSWLDPQTLLPTRTLQLSPELGSVIKVTATESLAIVDSQSDQKQVLSLHWAAGDIEPIVWQDAELKWGELSGDGSTLFLATYDQDATSWSTVIFDVEPGRLVQRVGEPMPGRVVASDWQGDSLLVIGGGWFLTDSKNDDRTAWTPPVQFGIPCSVRLDSVTGRLRVIFDTGMLAEFDSQTGRMLAQRRLAGLRSPSAFDAQSHDGRLVALSIDWRRMGIWEANTGRRLHWLPPFRWQPGGLVVAYLAWCAAWCVSGIRIARDRSRRWWQRAHLAIDIALVHAFPLGVLVLHTTSRPRSELVFGWVAVALALISSLAGLLSVWWIHGRQRGSLRLSGLLAGLAGIAAIVLVSGHRTDPGIWNVVLGSFSYLALLWLLLKSWHWFRFRVAHVDDLAAEGDGPVRPRWQLPLKDVMILTAAIGLLLAILRFSEPGARRLDVYWYVTVHGVSLAVAVWLAAGGALGGGRLWVRLAPVAFASMSGWIPGVAFDGYDPLWWCVVLHATTVASVFLCLLAARGHGFRLVRAAVA